MMKPTGIKTLLLAALLALPVAAFAGPSISVMDTAKPPTIDGDLSDWSGEPQIVLDKKENVVIGAGEWTGPSVLSAKVWVTYDAKFLYVAADITSQGPQFNGQEGALIYNGDCLELYVGTDNSNPGRSTYAPTDVQIGISPGKNGDDKAVVWSFTDKGKVPDATMGTKLTKNGYSIETAIPLTYLFKIDVGPGKSIAFDLAVDDIGAASKTRSLQLSWSKSDKGWMNPAVWGSLTFKGKTTWLNTQPKVDMSGAAVGNVDPMAGKKDALTTGTLLWGFNDGNLGGFDGEVSIEKTILTEGNGALKIDTEGSQGWNQNLAITGEIPNAVEWKNLKAFSMDVYYPKDSLKDASFGELYIITQGNANNWNQYKIFTQEGWNHIYQEVDASQLEGIYKLYIVFNSGGPIHGSVIVDNIRGHVRGMDATLNGKITNEVGKPLAGAILAVNRRAVSSGPDGTLSVKVPEDSYIAEVFCPGYRSEKISVKVGSGANNVSVVLKPVSWTVKPANIDVFFEKKIRKIDPHYMYGNNVAPWHPVEGFKDPKALEKIRAITSYIRVPGGGYSNIWNWKTAEVYKKDLSGVNWTTDVKWPMMADLVKSLGPDAEVLLTANLMTMTVQDTLDWIADIKKRGLKLRYVEMGNEPDYEQNLFYKGQSQYWTVIDNYCSHFLEFAKAVKARYPELKIMGPTCAQVENRERKEGSPWLADTTSPWWISTFLKKCAPYVDVVSVHTYPYWNNDNDAILLTKTDMWKEWVPKIREAIKQYMPDRADKIEIALTEWNSGDENSTTVRLVNAIFGADFFGQMMVWGINQTNVWDMYTQKPAQGGGHGVLDPNGDPDRPWAERSMYWVLYMLNKYFGTQICQAATSQSLISAYASEGAGAKWLLVVNKSPSIAFKSVVNLGAQPGKFNLDFYTLSENEYMWSENLYRAVINKGPTHTAGTTPVGGRFQYTFPPYTVTCVKFTPTAGASKK